MKAITIKQPWASLIVEGIKDIENRTWPTKYRGRVLIHASAKSVPGLPCEILSSIQYAHVFSELKLNSLVGEKGAIIGSVEIVDCVMNHQSIWADKTDGIIDSNTNEFIAKRNPKPTYNWVLANPILFPESIPAKGTLSFWDYPNILAEPEENNGELFCHCQLAVKEINQVTGGCGDYRCRYCGGKWYK